MSKINYSSKEMYYDVHFREWPEFINKLETNKRLKIVFGDLLSGIELKNKSFLEVGCGLGYFSQEAYKRGAKVTAVDIGKNLISKAQKKIPKSKFLVASALSLPFANNSFEIVLCTEVIEHTPDPKKAVSELIRVVKPGGKVVITSPNKLFKPFFSFLSLTGLRHYHGLENWLSVNELKQTIFISGGEIKKEKHFNFIYPTRFLDYFENLPFFRCLTINQGYLVTK